MNNADLALIREHSRLPYRWTFEDLLAYALVRRAAELPVILMQSSWLLVSKPSKPRVIISSGLVREGQRPAKKGRMLEKLGDSTPTVLELQPRADQAPKKINTSLLSNVTAAVIQLSDIFQGVVAFLDDSMLDRRNVPTYFTVINRLDEQLV
ncbi:uncharacterized protein CcaverHIS019_0410150 [Cutaneotrichosporon cavernicola]|uniref:Uncharacterized protein n=1 Tax=Cutaneotrichosporon cavernicola TaxID=279322 RepID=A0AA48L594_9TREE|nr:uncharacterized protein CcaverHIS019_0410150 [Cutaneotrichosporon cavernicola]BEI92195.1 hypothetical protein CcaverHIS019_0410150 [Cutaneotrichosporon cavernicola]BEI99966.1 hypothetical protein CcaverHIS631_0410090 [Cutaneotrichosporon cavernicola]